MDAALVRAGNEAYTDDIILDETAPTLAATVTAGTGGAARAAAARSRSIRLKAADNASGVTGYQVTANKKRPGTVKTIKRARNVAKTVKYKGTGRKLYVRVRDLAGNFSAWKGVRRARAH